MRIASIIVDNTSREVDRPFDYIIPRDMEDIVAPGMRVVVPFGGGNKFIDGYVIEIKDNSEFPLNRLKKIEDIFDDTIYFDSEMLKLTSYLKERYQCTLGEAFRVIMPSGVNIRENLLVKLKDSLQIDNVRKYKNIIGLLKHDEYSEFKKLKKEFKGGLTRAILFEMERDGFVDIEVHVGQGVNKKIREVYSPAEVDSCVDFIKGSDKRLKKQVEVLKGIIESCEELTLSEICTRFQCTNSVVKSLEGKGLLNKQRKEVYRSPFSREYEYGRVELTVEQRNAVTKILENYNNNICTTLVHGVTGCGKTEIYLNMAEQFINSGYGVIILVPEISLTPQTLERFKGRFGDVVAILHSRLSDGERYDEWRRIKSGEVKVVVGARSAVFAPVKNLKLIVMDEEHEYSYKSEGNPKYHTRDVAEFRVKQNGGLLILGSATPSMESYHKALTGDYGLVEIHNRINNRKLPAVSVVDMREELKSGNKSIFSRELFKALENNIEKREQSILFLNRRGHSTFISCRSCGYVSKCTNCDVSLTYHVHTNKLMCHYCGFEYSIPAVCPSCGSKYIKYFGAGTEKIEMELKKYFPGAGILRMDMDTTRKKGDHERIYNDFKNNRADILVGTQMISKGMDFKDVTLVGIIAADTTLNLPDFRAAERTFQLLTQVSGRAGRGTNEGRVIIQTYDPEHYSITLASRHDFISFYNKEIGFRKILNNPPFSNILYLTFLSEKEEQLIKYSMNIRDEMQNIIKERELELLGPTPCHIPKIKNNYRWHMIFKGDVYPYYQLINEHIYKILKDSSISYNIDVNPYSMI